MNAIIYGKGYWSSILQRYLYKNNINILKVIDTKTDKSEEMSLLKNCDIGFVCTPVSTHYKIVKKLLNNNIHVFCEKVMSKSIVEMMELMDLAKFNRLVLFTDYTYLYSNGIKCIRNDLNKIGMIQVINAQITQYGKFYSDVNALENIGVHLLSAIRYVLNDYSELTKNMICVSDKVSNYDYHYTGMINSVVLNIHSSILSNDRSRKIEFIGVEGILTYNMLDSDTVVFRSFLNDRRDVEVYDESNNLDNAICAFLKFIYDINENDYSINQKVSVAICKDLINLLD